MSDPAKPRPAVYRPASRFVLRTPALPFATIGAWGPGDVAALRAELRRRLDDPAVREAVFVASPELESQLGAWLEQADSPAGQGVERSLVRYLSRMAGRATPFGLFSGVSVGTVGAPGTQTRLAVPARGAHRRHTRLDYDYLFALCGDLARVSELRATLRFRPNTSLYRAAGRLRYAEARLTGTVRTYHLVAVDPTDYLLGVLDRARTGATLGELAEILCADPNVTREEADAFVQELVDTQLLVPDLQPPVTGREPTQRICELLATHPTGAGPSEALATAARAIEAIDNARVPASPESYRAIANQLRESLPTRVEIGRLFQVDMFKPDPDAMLGPAVVAGLTRGLELLRQLAAPDEDAFARFKQAFITRYETREVPLFEVLDEEAGIGFSDGDATGAGAPLLADVAFPIKTEPRRVQSSRRDGHLMRLASDAAKAGAVEIELTDEDLEVLSRAIPAPLGDTVSISGSIVAESVEALDAGKFLLWVHGIDTGPGARLLGRFCHGSPEVTALTGEICAAEHALRTDGAVFAEIVHLPEGRIGNILARPVLRPYEIVYLGASGADAEHQILVTDLLVSVVSGRVVLRSRRLGVKVLPRMTTAHNYSGRSLGVYRFLCTLGQQDARPAGWSWGAMGDAPFLPRVRRGRLVLSRARWLLSPKDLEPLEAASKGKNAAKTPDQIRALRGRQTAAVARLREDRSLPRWIVVADGDNELPVDLDNPLMVESFVDLVKGRSGAVLSEMFPGPDALCACGPDGTYVHEVVLSYCRVPEPPAVTSTQPREPPAEMPSPVIRRFLPGSPWLYAKIYTGMSTSDVLLREVIGPLVRGALADGLVERWFFIRYADPDWHLRVRFAGDPSTLIREVVPRLHSALAPLGDAGLYWRITLDTYEREVERYGGPAGIELAEHLFAADSEAVLAIVEASGGDAGADAAWRLTLRGCDRLLADLGLDVVARRTIMTTARDNFGAEHGMDTSFQKRLGEKFRKHKDEIAELLAASDDAPDHPLGPGLAAIARRSAANAPIVAELRKREAAGQLIVPIAELAGSYVHMHANRMLSSSSRPQELVLYDMLRRHYDGIVARSKQGRS